jgi:hypothetical protein
MSQRCGQPTEPAGYIAPSRGQEDERRRLARQRDGFAIFNCIKTAHQLARLAAKDETQVRPWITWKCSAGRRLRELRLLTHARVPSIWKTWAW